ncbi:MAG: peptidylprolyl isomerase [Patescibacteria group bacterium]
MNKIISIIIILVIIFGIYYIWPNTPKEAITPIEETPKTEATSTLTITSIKNLMHTITIETNKGTIVFETYDMDAPKTVQNFITLAEKNFYNGVIFHRVKKDFMIQGGDPTGTGRGGPGYTFADELDPGTISYKTGYKRGTVAMANAGPNTNGSQFFIMHKDMMLPHNYTIFGKVVSGLETVDKIANSKVDGSDKPLEDISIIKVTVEEKR